MEIFRNSDKSIVLQTARQKLDDMIRQQGGNNPILLLLSGGSAFELLEGLDPVPWGDSVTLGVLDERYSTDPVVNNFLQLSASAFFEKARRAGTDWIDTVPRPGETSEALADRFEKSIRAWQRSNPKGKIIITQGIGLDGHTAGIMPYPESPALFQKLFEDESSWVACYDAGEKNEYPLRVTVNISFLRIMVFHSIVYVSDEKKKKILQNALTTEGDLHQVPARVIKEMRSVALFTTVME